MASGIRHKRSEFEAREAAAQKLRVAEYDRLRRVMGEDFWSYGIEPNAHVLETLARYSHDQHLSVRQLPLAEMFAPSTYELSKI